MRDYNREVLMSEHNDALVKEDNKCVTCGCVKKFVLMM